MTPGLDASFAAYLTFTFLLVVTPGSTTAVVVRNALEKGRRAGVTAALGAAAANTTHATLAGVGLSFLITTFPQIVTVVRLAGAAYLAWLGAVSLRRAWLYADGGVKLVTAPALTPAPLAPLAPLAPDSDLPSFLDGLTINLLNPTIISFYVAIVPSFVPAAAPSWYYLLLAASHVSMAFVCHSMWAIGLSAVRRWFAPPAARRTLEAGTGIAMLALAIRVLWP